MAAGEDDDPDLMVRDNEEGTILDDDEELGDGEEGEETGVAGLAPHNHLGKRGITHFSVCCFPKSGTFVCFFP